MTEFLGNNNENIAYQNLQDITKAVFRVNYQLKINQSV